MILVDSSVWIDFFNGVDTPESNKLDETLGYEEVAIGDLILTEVLQGFRSDKDYRIAREVLASLEIHNLLGADMAMKSASNFRKLRKKGITVRKTADVVIATYCIEHKMPLLFSDKDFLPFVAHLRVRSAR